MIKKIILALFILQSSPSFADIGHDQGNGGDVFALHFVGIATNIVSFLQNNINSKYDYRELKRVVETTKVESTNIDLFIRGIPKDAINFPAEKKIIFNRKRWDEIPDSEKPALVVHEYLGVMGIDDSSYIHTSAILNGYAMYNRLPSTSSCSIATYETATPFLSKREHSDDGLLTIEYIEYQDVKFLLKAGRGTGRLEAEIKKKKVASTFYSYTRKEADRLTLSVMTSSGEEVTAYCTNINAFIIPH
jgi:hypothetical protein